MKNKLLILFLSLLTCEINAQPGQPLILGGNFYDYAADLAEGPGNTSILLASSSSYSEDQDLLLWCIDAGGAYQWHHAFGNPGFDRAIALVKDDADSLWVLAQHQSNSGDNSNTLLYRLGIDGQPAYVRTFDLARMEFPTDLFYSNNGLVIGGNVIDTLSGTRDIFVLRTDASGNELFRSIVSDEADDSLGSILEFNNNYFVCGTRRQFESDPTDILLQKLNISGQPVMVQTTGSPLSDEGAKVIRDADGNLLFAGSYSYITSDTVLNMWSNLYDENLTPLWPSPAVTIQPFTWRTTDACFMPNGHYLITGTLAETVNPDLFAYEIDANGIYAGSSSYGTFEPEWGKSLLRHSDGRVAFFGTSRNYGPGLTNLFYIAVPEENLVSTLVPFIQVGISETGETGFSYLVLDNALYLTGLQEVFSLQIRDAQGKLVAWNPHPMGMMRSGEPLFRAESTGIYFVSFACKGQIRSFKCFLSGNGISR